MSIYQDLILDHYRHPRNFGYLTKPTKTFSVYNALCGDKITMSIREDNGCIAEISFSGEGCAISQASASMLTEYVKGKEKNTLRKLPKEFIINRIGIELSPNRLQCALLSWEALVKILSNESNGR